MVEESALDKLVRMSKEHVAAYQNVLGFIAMTHSGAVQLSEPWDLDPIPGWPEIKKVDSEQYPYRISKRYEGVEFFVVASKEEYQEWDGEEGKSW